MKTIYPVMVASLCCSAICRAQSGEAALGQYQAFLSKVNTVEYHVQRIDTFPNKSVWNHKGQAIMQREADSRIMAARFLTTRFDVAQSYWYNGKTGYWLDDKAKSYEVDASPYGPRVFGSPGGQMLVEELLAIEPGFESVTCTTNAEGCIIRLHYPDLPKTDERNRYTYLVLDEANNQPKMVRTVSEKAGGKWSTVRILSDLRLNDALAGQALNSKVFLSTYSAAPVAPQPGKQAPALLDKPAPDFNLTTFTKRPVQLRGYRGKTVLLDFWTTSCSPCIAAMPNMQHLQEEYRKRGLVVVGILMDPKSAERARGIMKRQGAAYTALLGSEAVEKAYQLNSFPRYLLVNKNGKVTFDESGEGSHLETAIQAALK